LRVFLARRPICRKLGTISVSVGGIVAWLKRISTGQLANRGRVHADEQTVSHDQSDEHAQSDEAESTTYEEVAKLASAMARPPAIPTPKEKIVLKEKIAKEKTGFTIHSSLNGDSSELHMASPTLTVAKARMLFKSGRRVHVVDAEGRQFAPSEFDEILKFD
jgi:hypothetical protein